MAFWMAFLVWFFLMTERGHGISGGAIQLVFKRGAKIPEAIASSQDEEKGSSTSSSVHHGEMTQNNHKVKNSKNSFPTSGDIFSWHHLNYDITLKGGQTRRLLDDVSGYVAPGKLVCAVLLAWFSNINGVFDVDSTYGRKWGWQDHIT